MAVGQVTWDRWEWLALEASGVGLWWWDRHSGEVHWDVTLEGIYGLPPGTFGGSVQDWAARIHPDDRDAAMVEVEAALQAAGGHYLLFRTILPDGSVRWIESRGTVIADEAGAPAGMAGACQDVTDRQEADAAQRRAEQQLRERSEFLAEASSILGRASTDVQQTLQQLTSLAVPHLGDWCAVDLLEDGGLRLAAVAHVDPAKVQLARTMIERYGRASDQGAGRVVRTGQIEHVPDITPELVEALAHDDEHRAMLRELDLRSALVVPLRARGRTIGALTLIHGSSGRRYSEDDVATARDLAQRAAVAIDNAHLLAERSRVASMLQKALLPPVLPDIPGVELAGLYDAAEDIDIGGDFYDALGVGGDWTLVLGDVCGKGVEAASLTALARHTVRAAALQDPEPRQVLRLLNEALCRNEGSDEFCTAVCTHLRISEAGATLEVSAGGHPPALVLRRDGTVEEVGEAGMLLGCFDDVELASTRTELGPGDLVLLYTDGLTEARHGQEQFGVERVKKALAGAAGLSAEVALRHVHNAVEAWQSGQRDDTAMLACRIEP